MKETAINLGTDGDRDLPRVLHLRVASGTGGGPEKTILHSPRFIRPYGYEAEVVYLCPPQDRLADQLRQRAARANCQLTIFSDRGPFDLSVILRVVRYCRSRRIAILQAHDYKSNLLGLLIRRFHRCRLATMLHGWTDMSGRMPLYKRIDQWCLPFYEALICVSEDLVEECIRLKVPLQRVHLVHNAIDIHTFQRSMSKEEAKRRVGARDGRFLVGTVGRLSPEKGLSALIDVVVQLQSLGRPIDLWLLGDGSERKALEEKIERLGCRDSVRLLGHTENISDFFQAFDAFVLNSIREGLPNVILEAMAFETPVIATKIAGIPALVHHDATGQLIEASDSAGLSRAIVRAIEDSTVQHQLVSEARSLIETKFSFESRMQKVASIYDALLGRSPPASSRTEFHR